MFCHLHVHSLYSRLDGFGQLENFVKKAKELGQKYLAISDHGNIDGLIEFQKKCDEHGVKPILGCEAYICENAIERVRQANHILILVKNEIGFKNLCYLLTYSNLKGFYYKPRIDYATLLLHCRGLIISTACIASFASHKNGRLFFRELKKVMKDDLYCEIMPHNLGKQIEHNKMILKLARRTNSKIIVTNDCHYIEEKDYIAQDILLAIQTKAKLNDENRFKLGMKGLYLRSEEEMGSALKEIGMYKKEYLSNTIEVAKKCCDFRIKKRDIDLPKPIKTNDENQLLLDLCKEGYFENFPDSFHMSKEYRERLQYEFDIIKSKNFARYFLIVYDLVNYCRQNGILIGPGRGSVGGSLIAYLLGITNIDPLRFNLLFDRFINKDRIDYPDIDIDFEDTRRDDVRKYLERKYGENNIAGVTTFQRMNPKAAIQDVARVYGVNSKEAIEFSKAIDEKEANSKEASAIIDYAIKTNEFCQTFAEKYPKVIKYAKKLSGQIRNYSTHAAAIIISGEDLRKSDRCYLLKRKIAGVESLLINWEKDNAEYVGLMKLDALAIKLLSIFSYCFRLIKENHGIDINTRTIDIEDKSVMKEITKGNTEGAFQLNTWAMTNLIKEMGVEKFQHISDAVALVRPGPYDSGMTKQYIQRKHGKKWSKEHTIYEKITKDTYGMLVYQEQVMMVINKVAGLPYSTADQIRKIIGKKRDVKEFKKYEMEFLNGCKKVGEFSKAEAIKFWENLQKWASYGFNKCLTGDTLLERSSFNQYTGKYISIEELYDNWNSLSPVGKKYRNEGLQVIQLCKDNRCRPGRIVGVYYNGKKKVYKVKTKSGKEIKGTFNHRLLTFNGYEEIKNLSIGDRLAVTTGFQKTITEKLWQKWRKTNNKNKRGFQKGKNNPAYVDGRQIYFNKAKELVKERSNGICEECKTEDDNRFEFAHIKTLKECNNNYSIYHNKNNLKYLCNSCHKKFDYQKGERKKRYENGYSIFYDEIISIEYHGKEDVYDIEMEGPFHNFAANSIISHNSHSVGYALLGYYCVWLKKYYPTEFICASLTYGEKKKKNPVLIEEAYRLGLKISLPKIDKSHPTLWTSSNNTLYIPFNEVKGIGDKKAYQIYNASINTQKTKEENTGFFNEENVTVKQENKYNDIRKGKFGTLLNKLGIFNKEDVEITDDIKELFNFRIVLNPTKHYKNLYELFGGRIRLDRLDDILKGDASVIKKFLKKPLLKKSTFSGFDDLKACHACKTRGECLRPVSPSKGKINVMISGDMPSFKEDELGKSLSGKASKKIWDYLSKHGYDRSTFHVTDMIKCFPKESKKPSNQIIEICGKKFIQAEIEDVKPIVILAFGNTNRQFFEGINSGIMSASGSTTWNEKYKCWICWCIHPSSTFHNPDNQMHFINGMKNFVKLIKTLRSE